MAMLLRLKEKNAHTIFGALADELSKDGIELIDPRPWLGPAMPGPGFGLGPKLSAVQRRMSSSASKWPRKSPGWKSGNPWW